VIIEIEQHLAKVEDDGFGLSHFELATSLERPAQRQFIGKLQSRAGGQAVSDPVMLRPSLANRRAR
jgi:hypothetical protein